MTMDKTWGIISGEENIYFRLMEWWMIFFNTVVYTLKIKIKYKQIDGMQSTSFLR
jgi:hypothetical protein